MSWSTRITSAPNCSGILWITLAEVLGLLVGQPGAGLVEQHDAWAARRRRGRSRRGAARARRARRPWPSAATSRPTNSIAAQHVGAPRARVRRPSARGSSPRCRTPTAARSPARSGTCAAAPSARAGSRPSCSRSSPKARIEPAAGLDEAAEDVEERRLAGAVRADQAARPAGEDEAHVVDRRDAREAHGEALDLDHGVVLVAARERARTARGQPAEVGHVLRELLRRARRAPSAAPAAGRRRRG